MTGELWYGDVVKTLAYKGAEIRKFVWHIAYARNGNAHNPTVTYRWSAWRDGRCVSSAPRLRDVKSDIDQGA